MPTVIRIDEPNEKQKEFLLAKSKYVGYGGARGGGKSWSVRTKAKLLALKHPGIKILIMRRTYPELMQNHIEPLITELQGVARYKDKDKALFFTNKSKIIFGYCDSDRDIDRYQGNEYDVIFLDEATHFPQEVFDKLKACVRGANDFPKRMYITANPGGVGHEWVKRLFITRDYNENEDPNDYTFIKATVYDNKALMDRDHDYVKQLEELPEDIRKAWLEGSWDVFSGQYFTEYSPSIHKVQPFAIPDYWERYRVFDYGLDMLACYWVAVDEDGRAWVYDELYESGLIISDACKKILTHRAEAVNTTYAPPDLWNRSQDTGKSKAEVFAENGVQLYKVSNDRVSGWLDLKEWLKPVTDEFGNTTANLRIFTTCTNLLRCLPAVQHDSKNVNDVSKEPHELTHSVDALRYFVAGRPLPASIPVIKDEDVTDYDEDVCSFLSWGG